MTGPVDPALAALIADPRLALRPPPPRLSIADMRAAANAFLARVRGPAIALIEDLEIAASGRMIPVRLYRPTATAGLPLAVFVHGGGFVFGNLDTHDALCRTLARDSGAAVMAIDYRLAPDHPFPAALDDVIAVIDWLAETSDRFGLDIARLAMAGDSAGGHIALSTAVRRPVFRHLALIYPLLDPFRRSFSARDMHEGYMLTGDFLDWAWRCYAGDVPLDDNRLDLTRTDLHALPATTIVTAECDPLRDEGEAIAARLAAGGIPVDLRRYDGMIHGFAGLPHITPVAGKAIRHVAMRISDALRR